MARQFQYRADVDATMDPGGVTLQASGWCGKVVISEIEKVTDQQKFGA